ncbi:MAG: ATP-binding cassette domain-containing protein, partial [Pedobacter sp.]
MIEFRNVIKRFGKQTILDDVSCKIESGKTTVIIGPSGTGKSVFLKLLVGLLKPDSGQIFVDNKDITNMLSTAHMPSISLLKPLTLTESLLDDFETVPTLKESGKGTR